jgi:hypothetical protein
MKQRVAIGVIIIGFTLFMLAVMVFGAGAGLGESACFSGSAC